MANSLFNSNITLLVDSKLSSGKDCWNLSSLGQDAERFFTPDIAPDPIMAASAFLGILLNMMLLLRVFAWFSSQLEKWMNQHDTFYVLVSGLRPNSYVVLLPA